MTGKLFESGALVLGIWPDGSGEMKATFQYEIEADAFCQIPRDKGGPMLVRVSLHDGSFRAFPSEPMS